MSWPAQRGHPIHGGVRYRVIASRSRVGRMSGAALTCRSAVCDSPRWSGPPSRVLRTCDIVAFVATANPERARAFYEGVLGLPLVTDEPFALVFDANGVVLP